MPNPPIDPPQGLSPESAEVYYFDGDVRVLDDRHIDFLQRVSAANARKTARICLHRDVSDPVHEMIIAHQHDAYVRPHAHIGKDASLLAMDGDADTVLFDADGAITAIIRLSAARTGAGVSRCLRIPPETLYAILIRSQCCVFHETLAGPFDRASMVFPDWAPDETDRAAALDWLKQKVADRA